MDAPILPPASSTFARAASASALDTNEQQTTNTYTTAAVVTNLHEQQAESQPLLSPTIPPSVPSLTPEEQDALRKAVGSTASVLASAVSKLYLCPASLGEYRWTGVWGALALVVDRSPPLSKHIQLYDVHTWTRLLNVQLYHSMIYLEPNHLFHTFEIENALIGLSFGHHDQAHAFLVKVREHIPLHGSAAKAPAKKAGLLQRLFGSVAGGSGSGDRDSGAPGTISTPSSVVHTAHAGFDPVSGSFDQRDLPAEWRWLFEARGFHSHVHANANANANANASVDAGAANATNGSGSAS